ncbi:MAG: inorganic phosphate transporter [Sulfolobales archaeon]
MSEIAIVTGLVLSACIAWSIGANDMANSTSIAVGSGVLRIRTAMLVFASMLTLGSVLQGFMVMKTLGRGVVSDMDIYCAISSSLAAFTWIMVATSLGLPISTSHSITGAVVGVALSRLLLGGSSSINLHILNTIILSWITSPLAAAALAVPSYLVVEKLFKRSVSIGDSIARSIVIVLTAFSAYSFGANDVANATGVYVGAISKYFGTPDLYTMRLLSLFSSIIMAFGGIIMGKRVLVTLAYRITRLDTLMAIAAGLANAFTVWFFTTIPYLLLGYGLPISTTYAAAGAIMGASIAKNRGFKGVRVRQVVVIVIAWVLTLPVTAALGLSIYYLLNYLSLRLLVM